MKIYTIGHSTHSEEEFLSLLKHCGIETLVDVRSFPGSKYVPQFNKENMEEWVSQAGIKYIHMKELGGRRNKNKDIDQSLVSGWRKAPFRNYAAYSLTQKYEEEIDKLIGLAKESTVCYMCSEAVPWRCHRLLISNTLTFKGLDVYHIMTEEKTIHHEISIYGAQAVEEDSKLIYPDVEEGQDNLEKSIKI